MRSATINATLAQPMGHGPRSMDDFQQILALAESDDLAMPAAEAADALLDLARELPYVDDRSLAEQLVSAGRRLATPPAVEELLDRVADPEADIRGVAVALRFRGPDVIATVLERLNDAPELAAPRLYFNVVTALGAHAEIRGPLIAQLHVALSDRRWFVVRNAIMLLTAIGSSLPLEHLWDLARARHRQVRLALAHVIARWKPKPDGLDLLTALLDDEDRGVRYAAATALGPYAHPRARQALARRAACETDSETRAACEAALSRRVVALRSA